MISLIWTKSDQIGSRWIRGMTGEEVSHFAIVLDNRLVFHSSFIGANLRWLSSLLADGMEIVYKMDLNLTQDQEEAIYQRLIEQFDGEPYDWGAFFYLAFAMIRYRLMRIPIPSSNPLASDRANLCVELASCLDVIGIKLPPLDTTLPERLYYFLKEQPNVYLPKS